MLWSSCWRVRAADLSICGRWSAGIFLSRNDRLLVIMQQSTATSTAHIVSTHRGDILDYFSNLKSSFIQGVCQRYGPIMCKRYDDDDEVVGDRCSVMTVMIDSLLCSCAGSSHRQERQYRLVWAGLPSATSSRTSVRRSQSYHRRTAPEETKPQRWEWDRQKDDLLSC